MTTALVTGATGNIGSHVVGELVQRGVDVRAFVRDQGRALARLGGGVELAVGDFSDRQSIRVALDGVEVLFLACANHPEQVAWESNVIDAAVDVGASRIVKLSAVGAEIGSRLGFWDWQGRVERRLLESGVAWTILRPMSYMSNVLAFRDPIVQAGKIFAAAGDGKLAMIDPRDVAAVAAVTLTDDTHAGNAYTLTGPELLTYARVAEELSAAIGRPVEFVDVPDEAARDAMVGAGLPAWLVENLLTLAQIGRGDSLAFTTDTVQALIGRPPRTFAEFARDHAAAFR